MPLSITQRRYLRGLTHRLHPVVILGEKGPTEAVCKELDRALRDHELVKVKLVAPDRQSKASWTQALLRATGADLVHRVGHIVALYRRNDDQPKLALPR